MKTLNLKWKQLTRRSGIELTMGTLVLGCLSSALGASDFIIDHPTISGGSGTSTGSVFTVSGTIGQPATGTMRGGNVALAGGFWGIVTAIPTPDAPLLSIRGGNGGVTVSWPLPAAGWVLEQTPSLNGTAPVWSEVPSSQYQTNATHCFITVPNPVGTRFYRLRKT